MSYIRFTSHAFLFGCAFYENNPDCPFIELRKLAIEERVQLLKKITFQENNYLESTHKECLKKRKYLKRKIIH